MQKITWMQAWCDVSFKSFAQMTVLDWSSLFCLGTIKINMDVKNKFLINTWSLMIIFSIFLFVLFCFSKLQDTLTTIKEAFCSSKCLLYGQDC